MNLKLNTIENAEGFLKNGKTRNAIEVLMRLSKNEREDIYQDLLLTINRYNRNENSFQQGMLTHDEFITTENKIVMSLISIIDEYKNVITFEKQNTIETGLIKIYSEHLPITNFQTVDIFINDSIAHFSLEKSQKLIDSISSILEIEPQLIMIKRVRAGSVIVTVDMPFIYAYSLKRYFEEEYNKGRINIDVNIEEIEIQDEDEFINEEFDKLLNTPDNEILKNIFHFQEEKYLFLLYKKYEIFVFEKCILFISDLTNTKKATREIMTKAFENLHKFNESSSFKTWILLVTYRYIINEKRGTSEPLFSDTNDIPDDIPDYSIISVENDAQKRIFDKMLLGDKLLLIMKYWDDMLIREMAEFFGITESAIKMKLLRAKNQFLKIRNQIK